MPAVSNTSPLFNLAAIGQLNLLREQFGEVIVPNAVLDELQPIRDREEWEAIREALEEGWILAREVHNRETVRILTLDLDQGEAEAIALALELDQKPTLLIDESEGRSVAARLGLELTGVLGILLRAKEGERLESVRAAMIALRDKAGFYIQDELFQQVIHHAGEA